ncbi:unnamed protein product [Lepeophtheirus salmonis]|uniref:(salmon louse) hypothetical protein n=1 Tax=Lepeophtheirus salmonis TaxID=72036 RepID=A0A7R8CRL5_LEPSM|nr:unnamed protein product [Lepeophtheirus salmonis]CAF2906498.1 unnamed protein product [Lepeophtheirus salmonis]
MYHKSWPSLFVCKAGMSSRCHVDAFDSHFWMYLIKGKKKWTFFNPEFMANLCPIYHSSLDPSFMAANRDNIKKIPRKEVYLEPGQLLYVPHGWPHIVDNLEDSIAVSGNFVNYTNLPHALKQLKMISLSDACFLDFLEEFQRSHLTF